MTTKQQEEALLYFSQHAREWKERAFSVNEERVNVIRQRNGFVLSIIHERRATRSALDVGCGTGDLVCDIARLGVDATGVDFSQAMVDLARARGEEEELANAHFHCSSVFDFDLGEDRYDVISAIGFIEYISLEELDRLLDVSHQALSAGGSLVLGSRNRLFNIFSLNAFTLEEINAGTVPLLLREATLLATKDNLGALAEVETAPLQRPFGVQPRTGVDVSVRHQFTPAQLARLLRARGFEVKDLYPVHVHGVPPSFKAQHPATHTSISNLLQNYAHQHVSLVPYSSSFIVHAEKE
jgi:2-polyprenyl-3-methyl-5-hydroxy-6-metoxy-1,4-benzoquinol methylase